MPPVTVIRPDGSKLIVSEEEAGRLEILGYRVQSDEERAAANADIAKQEAYSTGLEKAKTVVEGGISGATLGISDLAGLTAGGESNERAAANPGYRLASELVGGLGPMAFGGEARLLSPAGALAEGAEAASAGIKSTALRRAVQGGIEGAGQGLGSSIAHAELTDEPLSVEAVVQSIGWAGLLGFGIGGGMGKMEGGAERMAVRSAAEKVDREAAQALSAAPERYGSFRGAVDGVVSEIDTATKAIDESLEGLRKESFAARPTKVMAAEPAVASVEEQMAEAEARRQMTPENRITYNEGAQKAWERVQAEARVGRPKALREAIDAWKETITGPSDQVARGGPPALRPQEIGLPDIHPIADAAHADRILRQDKALRTAGDLVAVREALKGVPTDMKGWLRMKPEVAEKTFAALEKAAKLDGISEAAKASLVDQMSQLTASTGVEAAMGNTATGLRASWEALRTATTNGNLAKALKLSAGGAPKGKGLLNTIVKAGAASVGFKYGKKAFGWPGAIAGAKLARDAADGGLVSAVLGIKNATAARIRSIVARIGPKPFRAARPIAARAAILSRRYGGDDPLRIRMDGSLDNTKDDQEAAVNRLTELAGLTPSARDALYRVAETVQAEGHPAFAAALHQFTVGNFETMFGMAPKDPGTVIRGGRSNWRMDDVQVEQFRRTLGVFHDGLGTIERMLETGHVSPPEMKALETFWPALLQEARTVVYDTLSQNPDWLKDQDIDVQAALSTFLGTNLHSSMRPEFVVAQQAMYANRPQPRPADEAYPDSGGRPPGPDKNIMATQAQRITEH